ncbi:MAG TPA: ABC transporter substrate-binding protein [Desulfosalsimonadaceae bacterium]|nr:ABC transporter substrate-binding protein [Desulfosalsimonadaceae bacterium]
MKKSIFWVCVIVCFIFSATAVYAEPEPYHVGCAFAVTGKASWLGEPERNTAQMVADEINANGGINGHKIVLHIEDTQGENTRAVNAVKKLIKKHNVCAVIGPSRSGTSFAVIPIAEKEQVPLLSCAAAAKITNPPEERRWIFKMGQNDSDAVRKIYDHMTARDISKVGIITGTTGFGAAGREQLEALSESYGIEIAADETYSPGATDMTAQLIRVRNSGAQAIVNWSIVPAQSIVPRNVKQLGLDMPLYQSHGFANIKYAEAAGEAAEGSIFPAGRIMAAESVPADHPQKEVLMAYKKAYESKFNDQVTTFGGHAYDAMHLIAKALENVGDDPAKIRDELEQTRFVGIGGIFEFSPTDHCGLDKTAFEMLTVKDGKFVVIKD